MTGGTAMMSRGGFAPWPFSATESARLAAVRVVAGVHGEGGVGWRERWECWERWVWRTRTRRRTAPW
ncbi:hypothetical protein, partial [Streptomyces olivaceus]|uniref:hypothetical protein n=1 Tax=Streptomyces olivaceus TaxID=47716 RepID=UPI0036476C92